MFSHILHRAELVGFEVLRTFLLIAHQDEQNFPQDHDVGVAFSRLVKIRSSLLETNARNWAELGKKPKLSWIELRTS